MQLPAADIEHRGQVRRDVSRTTRLRFAFFWQEPLEEWHPLEANSGERVVYATEATLKSQLGKEKSR